MERRYGWGGEDVHQEGGHQWYSTKVHLGIFCRIGQTLIRYPGTLSLPWSWHQALTRVFYRQWSGQFSAKKNSSPLLLFQPPSLPIGQDDVWFKEDIIWTPPLRLHLGNLWVSWALLPSRPCLPTFRWFLFFLTRLSFSFSSIVVWALPGKFVWRARQGKGGNCDESLGRRKNNSNQNIWVKWRNL